MSPALTGGEIARRNDAFRTRADGPYPHHGMMVLTRGIAAATWEFRSQVLEAVRSYDRFDEDDDPYGEHDFGSFELGGKTLFWKIDCYATPECFDGADPLDPRAFRVLTIMYAEEY